ncbi:hypothetical protein RFI_02196 [Reticulomyxa filosa]|uniref:Kelch motif family protein n=1 Tax=Reticulomyxa filosa TaxID=46433 RepID=X6PB78_RETFI|nr:hypothetical protein RFI_02196 [Reticulomyxa filosa]|eukprot:ETO34892.1 hypothetical protein RFI_02196 [Reticulomyxa filosa]
MGNRTTKQKTPERSFQALKGLPTPLYQAQCVLHKHELVICGGVDKSACYSYHTLKNEYKFICEYPSDIELEGHCVVKLVGNNNANNQITLLSFGGRFKHTLVMKYVSIWSDISNKSDELNNYNKWIPFTDNQNHPIIIGRYDDDYTGVRAVIGGINNHLLFITYFQNNISVFDLNTFQFIKHGTLPTNNRMRYHCFVSNSENEQVQEMTKTSKQKYQMLLFKKNTGLSIEYDEDNNNFQFHQLPVCEDIAIFNYYGYVCVNDIILFFGGWSLNSRAVSKSVHKYSIRENKWITFRNTLHSPLYGCVAIFSEDDNDIHIIGGKDNTHVPVSTHIKINVRAWDASQLSKKEIKYIVKYWIRTSEIKFGWINDFDKIIIKYSRMN